MKLVIMHDSAPDDLPGHIGCVRNVESMQLTALVNAVYYMIVARGLRAENVSSAENSTTGATTNDDAYGIGGSV